MGRFRGSYRGNYTGNPRGGNQGPYSRNHPGNNQRQNWGNSQASYHDDNRGNHGGYRGNHRGQRGGFHRGNPADNHNDNYQGNYNRAPRELRNGNFHSENHRNNNPGHHYNASPMDMSVVTSPRRPRNHGHTHRPNYCPPVFRLDGDGDMIMDDPGANELDLKTPVRPMQTGPSTHELFLPVKGRLVIEMEQFVNTDTNGEEHSESHRRRFEFAWVPGCACQECVQEWGKASRALSMFNPGAAA
ncbi:uncharacterized protein N7459_001094 [Penicillium hispanicum]|uniref:uncharacterized protein n=1 Tax=Penicillium hispanicum TaxID=1080232 RepID=UPI0025425BA0|nr:uncharacterized protein N7459_001094 [Penicillium hispanicum]KAJ5594886.1 hypothetical protein N7459_001094 [Penicillium hispanicum]